MWIGVPSVIVKGKNLLRSKATIDLDTGKDICGKSENNGIKMNTYIPENATVKVFQTPDGRMVATSNIIPTLRVEVIPVANLYADSREGSRGLPFQHDVNEVGTPGTVDPFESGR